ncbi:MAG TPA: efflux RND transporter periplasmic adaptor subunit [Steroidobacteraceae bacterium]|nr:efflux RND transporter periplasmic adaptor subunit [Steroidobacteraceae bacterium]
MRNVLPSLLVSTVIALTLAGCARNEAAEAASAAAAAPPPQVSVAQVVQRPVNEFDEFTGRFEAIQHVDLRPRVSGYISSVNFVEGREVKKGDVLFVIDPRPYQAEFNRAKAQLEQARTQLSLAKSERERAAKLVQSHAISQEEFDTRTAGNEQASVNVDAAQAALDSAQLNLTWTRVTAPIDGRISRAQVTAGNFVTSGQTMLTTIVSLDPIYVTFDDDEQAYLKYAKQARDGDHASSRNSANTVLVGLANESDYPHSGVMVFVDNALDPATGTIRSRAKLDNHDRIFTPGLFARIKLLGRDKHNALLINDSAVGTDQNMKYVFVVGADNKIEYRPVKLGPIVDGLRVIREGLSQGETIVVNGLQRVRPGASITPEKVAMGERSRDGNHGNGADSDGNTMLAQN